MLGFKGKASRSFIASSPGSPSFLTCVEKIMEPGDKARALMVHIQCTM